jgi:hypothetical protein
MSADKLLLWMSARSSGSWPQFRAAVEELHVADSDGGETEVAEDAVGQDGLPLYQALRLNLQRVGHAEFFAGAEESEWRVTPPSLSAVERPEGWLGVAVGARSVRLLERLRAAAGSRLEEAALATHWPTAIFVRGKTLSELADVAALARLHVQADAPRALLGCVPAVDDPVIRRPEVIPIGADWRIEGFDALASRWKASTRAEVDSGRLGLYRFSLAYRRHVLFCDGGGVFEVAPSVGKFLAARRRRLKVMRYDALHRTLRLPSIFRPPLLIERALVLCSGRPPTYEPRAQASGLLTYADIPGDVARLAASLLRQELR